MSVMGAGGWLVKESYSIIDRFSSQSLHKVHEMNACWGRLCLSVCLSVCLSALFILEITGQSLIKFSNWVKIFNVGLL